MIGATLRHSPDLFIDQVSATAGPTIGIRRTFFFCVDQPIGFQMPRRSPYRPAYKASYKSFCSSKANELLLKTLNETTGLTEQAGEQTTQERKRGIR